MKQFYPDFESIHVFTLSLDFHQNELECAHCRQNDQFVSHGIIYKQRSGSFTEKVGILLQSLWSKGLRSNLSTLRSQRNSILSIWRDSPLCFYPRINGKAQH